MKRFRKNKEDFVCENCGRAVEGDGYTNHCPGCLCSKHVDVNPGDRAEECGGLMPVVGVELCGGEYILTQECRICGHRRRNRARDEDMKALIELSRKACF